MQFNIKHTIRYSYSRMVFCEPFTVRLSPREDAAQRLIRHQLSIDPAPAGMSDYLDVEGNAATQCWFNAPTCSLTITVANAVETKRTNPFDFLLEHGALELPVKYPSEICAALAAYRTPAQPSGPVMELAEELLAEAKRQTVPFLCKLSHWISTNIESTVRLTGEPMPAEASLSQRSGSCRDLTVLFIEACRSLGLASRFVSGYQGFADSDEQQHLHAWAEVYLPGAGWRGFDPTLGLAVADGHVAVAAGQSPLAAAPTSGTFRGTGVTANMDAQVVVRVV